MATLHDELNQRIFDGMKMRDNVREALLKIVQEFLDKLNENEIPIVVIDYRLVGSNAAYNYTSKSDIDVHIIADLSNFKNDSKLLQLLYDYFKSNFNDKYDITVRGMDVELYIEDSSLGSISNGVYSIKDNEWVKKPKKINAPDFKVEDSKQYKDLVKQYQDIKDDEISDFIDNLYVIRKVSLSKGGEFAEGNLIFKAFRDNGYLDDLKTRQAEIRSKELSLESLEEVYPDKGEPKKDFISRFMTVTKNEYPDVKQRYAVANSYWERRNKKRINEDINHEMSNEYDSEGNQLTKAQAEFFKNSKIRDNEGRLLVVYHGTNKGSFTEFRFGDIGFHLGTKQSAIDRGLAKTGRYDIRAFYLNITNPCESFVDVNTWSAFNIAYYIIFGSVPAEYRYDTYEEWVDSGYKSLPTEVNLDDLGEFTPYTQTLLNILKIGDEDGGGYDAEDSKAIRHILSDLGYDGVLYDNEIESAGDTSYMAFEPNQIKSITNLNPTSRDSIDEGYSHDNYYDYIENVVKDRIWEDRYSIAKDITSDLIDTEIESIQDGGYSPSWYDENLTESELEKRFTEYIANNIYDYVEDDYDHNDIYREYWEEAIDDENDKYDDFKDELYDALDTMIDEINEETGADIDFYEEDSHSIAAGRITSHYYHINNGDNSFTIRVGNGHDNGKSANKFDLDYRDGLNDRLLNDIEGAIRGISELNEKLIVEDTLEEATLMHWGDLDYGRKADRRAIMAGRGTGHFGTGFYFVSKDKYDDMHYDYHPERPIYELDTDSYHLFKPKTVDDAYALHDALKQINRYARKDNVDFLEYIEKSDKMWHDLSKLEDKIGWEDGWENDVLNFVKTYGDSWLVDRVEYMIQAKNWYDLERFPKRMYDDYEESHNEVKDAIRTVEKITGTYKDLESIIPKAVSHIDAEDSISTEVMKALGFEGVDVSYLQDENGWQSPDNFTYGSVIYDLKPNTYRRVQEPRGDYSLKYKK